MLPPHSDYLQRRRHLPNPKYVRCASTLVQRPKAAIEVSDIEKFDGECAEAFLWILVLGGIAALDKPERPWFVSQLALAVEISKIDWDAAEKTFENLLWLESACSPGGRQLWDEVMGTAEYKVNLD
jgi:hypothetical protein